MEREEVDPARLVAARVEALPEVGDERGRVADEARRERDEPREVGLSDELALAELLRQLLEPTRFERGGADGGRGVISAPF